MFGRILDCHSSIACPFELAVPSLIGRRHWKFSIAADKLKDIARHYKISPRQLLPSRLRQTPEAKIRSGIESFTSRVSQAENKSLFIVKDPCHFAFIDRIVAMFGQESLLLLSRSALPTCASLVRSFGDRNPLKTWASAHAVISQYANRGAFHVRYEDLVSNPAGEVGRTCEFLGVPFEESMLDYNSHQHTDDVLKLWGKTTDFSQLVGASESSLQTTMARGTIDAQHNQRRLQELPEEIRLAYERDEHDCKSIEKALGYESESHER